LPQNPKFRHYGNGSPLDLARSNWDAHWLAIQSHRN